MTPAHYNLPAAFGYRNRRLQIESLSVETLADAAGTPFYCYSKAQLLDNIARCQDAFNGLRVDIHYAMKACSNLSILRLIAACGLGIDLVSVGEMKRALAAGFSAERMIFSGVGKTASELQQAMAAGVGQFNVESAEELQLLIEEAAAGDYQVRVALRVNPAVDAGTHRHITTGSRGNKFGIAMDQVLPLCRLCVGSRVHIQGLAMHIGSQISSVTPYVEAIGRLITLIGELESAGFQLLVLDLGGGFGVDYGDDQALDFNTVAAAVASATRRFDGRLIIEPGRSLVASAAMLVSRVSYVKEAEPVPFLIVDAAMNDLMRPALYQAVHPLIQVRQPSDPDLRDYDVVGPVCESTDTFARSYPLSTSARRGDLLAFMAAGAYGAVMCSAYNSRDLIPEVLVDGSEARLIRQRVDQQTLMSFEQPCPMLV